MCVLYWSFDDILSYISSRFFGHPRRKKRLQKSSLAKLARPLLRRIAYRAHRPRRLLACRASCSCLAHALRLAWLVSRALRLFVAGKGVSPSPRPSRFIGKGARSVGKEKPPRLYKASRGNSAANIHGRINAFMPPQRVSMDKRTVLQGFYLVAHLYYTTKPRVCQYPS